MIDNKGNQYCYLNGRGNGLEVAGERAGFFSKLETLLTQGSQGKAPPKQWAAMIQAFQQKGIKRSELQDSGILERLGGSEAKSLTKDEVVQLVRSGLPTVKEVELAQPHYEGWRHKGGTYKEYLFVLNSQRDNVQDELGELESQIEAIQYDATSIAFSLGDLMDDPELPVRMQKRIQELKLLLPVAWDFKASHFSSALDGSVDKNIMAHARVTERGSLYFVEEIQSDWAQSGGKKARRLARDAMLVAALQKLRGQPEFRPEKIRPLLVAAINEGKPISFGNLNFNPKDPEIVEAGNRARALAWDELTPAAPFVTNTEEWSGLVLRRLIQRAAAIPQVNQFAWITQSMRNGGRAGGGESLDDFYKEILPKLADKVLKPHGVKVTMGRVNLGGNEFDVPTFSMTPAMKDALCGPMPLYSLSPVWAGARNGQEEVNRVLAECNLMMGTSRHVKVLDKLYDLATAQQVAGKYINNGILLNLHAKNLDRAARHEAWHFATENMLTVQERIYIRNEFAAHKPLAHRTRQTLIALGEVAAAHQCADPEECAAHAFALWSTGEMQVTEELPRGIFHQVADVLRDLGRWVFERMQGEPAMTTEKLFESMRSGQMATLRQSRRALGADVSLDVDHEAAAQRMAA